VSNLKVASVPLLESIKVVCKDPIFLYAYVLIVEYNSTYSISVCYLPSDSLFDFAIDFFASMFSSDYSFDPLPK